MEAHMGAGDRREEEVSKKVELAQALDRVSFADGADRAVELREAIEAAWGVMEPVALELAKVAQRCDDLLHDLRAEQQARGHWRRWLKDQIAEISARGTQQNCHEFGVARLRAALNEMDRYWAGDRRDALADLVWVTREEADRIGVRR